MRYQFLVNDCTYYYDNFIYHTKLFLTILNITLSTTQTKRKATMLLPIEYKKLRHDECLFIDVRSPKEYKDATIQDAINLALFSDEQRAIIGTLYKHQSPLEAKRQGVQIVSEKLPELFDTIMNLKEQHNKRIVLFCARGGARSSSLALLLNGLGENIYYIKDGYKGYRKHILSELPSMSSDKTFVVLNGRTGVGKTKILEHLKELGHDVLDLEKLASHRGSLLGSVGLEQQPSTKTFESRIYHTLKNSKSNFIFVEAESRRIGKLFIPEYIKKDMTNGIQLFLDASLDFRANILTDDYTKSPTSHDELKSALDNIRKYMGNEPIDRLQAQLDENNYHEVAKTLMTDYYDPMYDHNINKHKYDYSLTVDNLAVAAQNISEWLNAYITDANAN